MASTLPLALPVHGEPLRYGLPFKGKSDLFRTLSTPIFEKQLRAKKKILLPVFNLWSLATIKLIVADFDHLPGWCSEAFPDMPDSELWDLFRADLKHSYDGMGLVLRSPSGKAKIIFKVQQPKVIVFNKTIALDTLDLILKERDSAYIDRSTPAANRLFVNQEMLEAMREGLDRLPILEPVLTSLESPKETEVDHEAESPTILTEPIPAPERAHWIVLPAIAAELDPFNEILKTEAEWFLVRFIAGSPKLGLSCIGLPQNYIVEQSRHYLKQPLSLAQVSRAIKYLISLDLLSVVDDHYAPGRKAKHYRAEGLIRRMSSPSDFMGTRRTHVGCANPSPAGPSALYL